MERGKMLRSFFLGFVKIHILHHACHEPVYGVQLIAELARHGYDLSPGTLYPILHDMERSGYLTREERLVAGKIRKYYRATVQGEQALAEARAKIAELVAEVLAEAPSISDIERRVEVSRGQECQGRAWPKTPHESTDCADATDRASGSGPDRRNPRHLRTGSVGRMRLTVE